MRSCAVEACDDGNNDDTDASSQHLRGGSLRRRVGAQVSRLATMATTTTTTPAATTARGVATYPGTISVGNLYQQRDALEQHNQRCQARYGGNAHQCTRLSLRTTTTGGSSVRTETVDT